MKFEWQQQWLEKNCKSKLMGGVEKEIRDNTERERGRVGKESKGKGIEEKGRKRGKGCNAPIKH